MWGANDEAGGVAIRESDGGERSEDASELKRLAIRRGRRIEDVLTDVGVDQNRILLPDVNSGAAVHDGLVRVRLILSD
jgi:hypothetical protein